MSTFQEFLTSLSEVNTGINLLDVVAGVLVAAVLGIIICLAHKFTTDEFSYDKEMGLVFIFVPAVVALLISVTGTNVARAFSIAGVLAIIRYRSTIIRPRDIAYIFFCVAAGFAAGVKLYLAAFVIVVLGVIIAAVYAFLTAEKTTNVKKLLKVAVPESIDYAGLFDEVLAKYTSASKLVSVQIISGGTVTELTYAVKLKDAKDMKAFLDELRTLNANFKIAIREYAVEVNN